MTRSTTKAPEPSEDEFQTAVLQLAEYSQYEIRYHNPDSRRSQAGFPDLVLISSARRRALFRELKKEDGRVRPKQKVVLAAMTAAGLDAAVWRPSDLASGRIAKELRGNA